MNGPIRLTHSLIPFSLHPSIWWNGFMGIADAGYLTRDRPREIFINSNKD